MQFIQHAHAISVQNVLRVRVPITLKIVTAALLFHLAFGAAGSAEELNIGHLETGDDTGINWLNFHCNQNSGSLTCDVFQTLIMHKVEPAEREKEINKKMAGDVVQEFKRAFADPCKNIDQLLELVRKSVATGVGRDGRNLNPRQAQEAKLFFESMADTCKNSNQGTIKHFIEIGVDKDIHTCRVINNYSPMKFSFDTTTQMWISKEGPTGPCGSISVGTLERDKKSSFWLYTEKVMWTNPSGTLSTGLSCSQFHDRTFHYTWRAADNFVECTHIENGMN